MRTLPAELRGRWNHNTHYYPLALRHAHGRALDVGCGDGLLLRLLAPRCAEVVGIDPWPRAGEACADLPNVRVIHGDFLGADLEPNSFDLVVSVTAIHHLPFEVALERMAALVRPGGRLVVVGVANNAGLLDRVVGGAGVPAHRIAARRYGLWEHPAPIADPSMSWRAVKSAVRDVLPDATYRRRLYWRYSIEWTKP